MSFPRYPEYKDSGQDWLGTIPSHWSVIPLAKIALGPGSLFIDGDWVESKDLADDGIRYITTGNVGEGRYKEQGSGYISQAKFDELRCTEVLPGDVLISRLNLPIGRACVVPDLGERIITSVDNVITRPDSSYSRAYLAYMLSSASHFANMEILARGTTMQRISRSTLGQVRFAFPTTEEQTAIATFLDRETAKIDALVAEQEKLIVLLQEKRQAVISHAVTKGLDPDVPMKDSGVEWLGEVPGHWEVGAIKRFFSSLDGRRVPLSAEERSIRQGDFPYYGASGVIDSIDAYIFDEDLVLVSEDGANLLSRVTPIAFIATGKYWVNNHAHILKPIDTNVRFWAERIEALELAPVITGSAQPKLTIEALMNLVIAAPPTAEERASIGFYIQKESKKLDSLLSEARTAITLLQERRSALICAAVTGQIDVRGIASPEAA
jgi:type I restriction enzyme, S subunit